MTVTTKSQTSDTRYFLTIDEQGHATACTCPDRYYRSTRPACKHMAGFNTEVQRAATFLALKERFDVRGPWEQARRREAYCQAFGIY